MPLLVPRKIPHTVNVHTAVALPQRQTKTEIDGAVGRRKRRRTKEEFDEEDSALWDRAKRQLSFSWRLPQSDEGRRRQRQTKKKTNALWVWAKRQLSIIWWPPKRDEYEGRRRRRRLTLGWSKAAALHQVTTTPEWRRQNLIPHLPCDSLTPEPMEDAAVSAAPGPVVEPPQSPRSWTYFQ